jgi:aminoglycoside phosphotransferase (APT) family kinase protein
MRQDGPSVATIISLLPRVFGDRLPEWVARVPEGRSTHVYRLRRDAETFYLRVLPEAEDSFAPEVRAHVLLRSRGVRVPEVVYFEHRNELVQRSIMVTTQIPGCAVGHRPVDATTRSVVVDVGHQLAVLNDVPVAGFGWIRRDRADVVQLEAEHPMYRAFTTEYLNADLDALEKRVLPPGQMAAIRDVIATHAAWLESERGRLAHGDFDVTHIFQENGCYSGIIDFGEIRGTDRIADLEKIEAGKVDLVPEDFAVERLLGEVTVQSEHGRGSTLTMRLPALATTER